MKKGFKKFTQTGLLPWHQESKRKREVVCPYDMVHPLALQYASKCSNQYERIYSESGSSKHVNRKTYIIESRIKLSSERDQNLLKMCNKNIGTMYLKSNLMKTWLKKEKLENSKKTLIIHIFHL